MVSAESRERIVGVTLLSVAVLSFLYSLLIVQQIALWSGFLFTLLFFYLLWRFVRAHERIAVALEQDERN